MTSTIWLSRVQEGNSFRLEYIEIIGYGRNTWSYFANDGSLWSHEAIIINQREDVSSYTIYESQTPLLSVGDSFPLLYDNGIPMGYTIPEGLGTSGNRAAQYGNSIEEGHSNFPYYYAVDETQMIPTVDGAWHQSHGVVNGWWQTINNQATAATINVTDEPSLKRIKIEIDAGDGQCCVLMSPSMTYLATDDFVSYYAYGLSFTWSFLQLSTHCHSSNSSLDYCHTESIGNEGSENATYCNRRLSYLIADDVVDYNNGLSAISSKMAVFGSGTYYFYYDNDETGLFADGQTVCFCAVIPSASASGDSNEDRDVPYGTYSIDFRVLDSDTKVIGERILQWTDRTDLPTGDYWYRAILTDGETSVTSNSDWVTIAGDTTEPTSLNWTDTSTLTDGTWYYRGVLTSRSTVVNTNSDSVVIDNVTDDSTILTWTDTSTLSAGDYYYRAVVNSSGSNIESNSDGVTIASIPDDPDPPTDTTAPVVTLLGESSISLANGASWSDPGATATDDTDGSLTPTVTYSLGGVSKQTFDSTMAGTWSLTYSATDSAGNTGTVSRTITVAEAVITPPDDPDPPVNPDDPDPTPTVLENAQTVTWTDESDLENETTYYYRSKVNNNGAEIESNSDSITTGQTVSWTDTGSKAPGNYYYRAIVTSDGTETTTNSDGVTIVTETINLSDTTFEIEAHATSSKLITCSLSKQIGTNNGISVQWQYTTTDPASGTPTWASYGTGQTSVQTICGLTANQKYWFRAILTQGQITQTTESDPAWLTQINRPARAVHETSVQDKNFGDSIIFLARLEDADGNCLTQDDISEIKYQIAILSTSLGSEAFEAVEGHSNITVPKHPWLLEPFPVTDYGWTLDSTGYNFAFCPSNADDESFPSEGLYKITFSAVLQNGEKLKFEYRIFLS